MTDTFDNCWFLSGATATGKTGVALALAERLGAEIVSLDSMTVYRGMDVGTAKPRAEERARVPHHLLDVVDPADEYSVAQYVEDAATVVRTIRARGREVLFVGGTPLYLKSLLRGLFDGPPADWLLREEIEAELAQVGQAALHERLTQVDPVAASVIHPHDTRRMIRALEVYRATGEPLSHQQMQFDDGRPAEECRVFVLRRERAELHRRIEGRVEAMIDVGLVDEVRGLMADGKRLGRKPFGRTASQAVGYREALGYLSGEIDHNQMLTQMQVRTRRFAKRQGTWFRSLSECRFVDVAGEPDTVAVAEQIAAAGT
jgi:tRNA dimethylallyltransferase